MKTGYAHWLARGLITTLMITLSAPTWAQTLTWSDRVSEETSDGEIVDTAPFVKLGSIAFSRFTDMQAIALETSLKLPDTSETLHVFRVWQGGASQGEQLMLLSVSEIGVDVIGPHEQDFEVFEITMDKETNSPVFLLKSDNGVVLAKLGYFSGMLVKEE